MSYLNNPATDNLFGLVVVGNNINVANGTISIEQSVSPNSNVTFNSVSANSIKLNGANVITSVVPTSGNGIAIANLVSSGPNVSFTVLNTGVLSLTSGPGISLSSNTGNITISASGADFISVTSVTSNYTASIDDEYIGVDSANATTISLPAGVDGRVYTIKDERGQGSGTITIQGSSGQKIDKANTYIIKVPFQSISVVFSGGGWRII